MKWDDIAKRLPGRSSISCRLRYQNYLEKRAVWDEEKKNKLARLYARYVPFAFVTLSAFERDTPSFGPIFHVRAFGTNDHTSTVCPVAFGRSSWLHLLTLM